MTAVVAEPGFGVVLAAGVASFLSPCVAPLAPGYLAFIAGTAAQRDDASSGGQIALLLLGRWSSLAVWVERTYSNLA